MKIKHIIEVSCKRCGHVWIPRQREVVICPKCKSPYWNRERKITKAEVGNEDKDKGC